MKVATTKGPALPVLLSCVVVSIVLGILGMHILTTHGVTAPTAHESVPEASAMPAVGGHHDSSAASTAGHAGLTDSSPSGSDRHDGHDMGSTLMLCVAMLAAAGLLVLATLGGRRTPRLWAYLPDAPTTVHRFAFPRLATGPPPVWQFSVIRC